MHRVIILLLWSCLAGVVDAADMPPVAVEVAVEGVRGTNGVLRAGLFRKDGFPRDESRAVRGAVGGITGTVTVVAITNVTPGEYAVLVYHDVNANGRLDYDGVGRPREGYGVSGGARRTWRGPRYAEAKLDLHAGNRRVNIPLAY